MRALPSNRAPIVQHTALPLLTAWQNFYVIIGSSAGALTGLMFVVITLIAGTRMPAASEPIAAFSTPNVVHFCATLLMAAILSVPWQALWHAGLALGGCGIGGCVYIFLTVLRFSRQTDYAPVLEDWLWHTILPLAAYTAVVVSAVMLPGNPGSALLITGGATMLLLFVGIHNAWDIVTYVVVQQSQAANTSKPAA